MTKKRFLAMLLTGAMTLSLAACGGTSTGSDAGTDSGADSGSDSYKIALIQQHQTNAFQIEYPRLLRPRLTSWALT